MAEAVIKSPRSWLPPITSDSQQVPLGDPRTLVHAACVSVRSTRTFVPPRETGLPVHMCRRCVLTHSFASAAHLPGVRQIIMTKTFKGKTDTSVFGGTVRRNKLSKDANGKLRDFLADRFFRTQVRLLTEPEKGPHDTGKRAADMLAHAGRGVPAHRDGGRVRLCVGDAEVAGGV